MIIYYYVPEDDTVFLATHWPTRVQDHSLTLVPVYVYGGKGQ